MRKRLTLLKILQPVVLIICTVLIVLAAVYRIEQTALLSIIIVMLAMVPFFLRFERLRPKPRDIVPIVVMCVVAALGRAAFTFLPNMQPVTAIVIVSGIVFGAQAGFLTGALAALTSNMFMGQGPWTPWQMLAWGLMGYTAGLLQRTTLFRKDWTIYVYGVMGRRSWTPWHMLAWGCTGYPSGLLQKIVLFKKDWTICIYGFVVSWLFGWFMNLWHLIGFVQGATWEAFAVVYGSSAYFDLMHAISTVIFLVLILVPWRKKLGRIKQKYGMNAGLES